jgi:hypothetical protein
MLISKGPCSERMPRHAAVGAVELQQAEAQTHMGEDTGARRGSAEGAQQRPQLLHGGRPLLKAY